MKNFIAISLMIFIAFLPEKFLKYYLINYEKIYKG